MYKSALFCKAQTFALLDAGGRPVSTMVAFAELLPHDDGKSVERDDSPMHVSVYRPAS